MTPPTSDISLEFMRRTLAGQTHAELLTWATTALTNDQGADADDGWSIRTAAHALEPHAPLEYLVDQLLSTPSLNIVYGGPGSLKSMILADMAVCVAAGKRWLEDLDSTTVQPGVSLATMQAPVLWVDFDNGKRRTDIRIGAMLRAHGLGPETPIHYVSMATPHLDASNVRHMEALTSLVKRNGYRLIIVDNLGLITGKTEENSAEMANVMGNLRRLSEDAAAAVVLIHHQRKSNSSGDSNGVRKGETLRGHSSIEASLDLALLVERKEGEDVIAIIPTKVRDFVPFTIIGAHFTYEHAPDSRDLWQARFFSQAAASRDEQAQESLRSAILEECRSHPGISQKDLIDSVRVAVASMPHAKPVGVLKVRGVIKNLVTDGHLREGGVGNLRTYFVS